MNRLQPVIGALIAALPLASAHAEPSDTQVITGSSEQYAPLPQLKLGGMSLVAPIHMRATGEGATGFAIDRDGNAVSDDSTISPSVRVGLTFSTVRRLAPFNFFAEYEHDLATGYSGTAAQLPGEGYPLTQEVDTELRKAYLRGAYKRLLMAGGGVMTSHWGLGLLANDGAHGFEPGSARFSDPRSGDRVLRGFMGVGMSQDLGLVATVAADSVLGDDVLLEGDEAVQLIGAVRIGEGKLTSGGAYLVYRDQEASDGDGIEVVVVDVTGKSVINLEEQGVLTVEGEAAFITGETTLAPSMDYATHDIRQLGVAARASLDRGGLGGVLDLLYASGDRNFDDDTQNAFKADPNYELGFLLFRRVMAAQTARAVATASDLNLVGQPAEDLERFPTRGSVSNTIAFFPRAWWRPLSGLEVYGGPLIAFTAAELADPFNSRIGGGTPRNALDGDPGRYLGTELDLGVRYRALVSGTMLHLGLEGGMFQPGGAFDEAMGGSLSRVWGARAMVGYQL